MQTVAVLGLASVIVACSSSSPESPSALSSPGSPSALSQPSASPTLIPGNPAPGAAPVVLHKQIGEAAHIGCPEGTTAGCDIDFVITSIQSEVPCVVGDPIDADQQLVRIDLDVTTSQQFLYPTVTPSSLYWSRWGIGGDKGVAPELQPYFSNDKDCVSDQSLNKLLPGSHVKVSWLVKAPKGSTILRLYNSDYGDGWTWTIPPNTG